MTTRQHLASHCTSWTWVKQLLKALRYCHWTLLIWMRISISSIRSTRSLHRPATTSSRSTLSPVCHIPLTLVNSLLDQCGCLVYKVDCESLSIRFGKPVEMLQHVFDAVLCIVDESGNTTGNCQLSSPLLISCYFSLVISCTFCCTFSFQRLDFY